MKLSTVSLDDELPFGEADFFMQINTSPLQPDSITLGVCSQACPKCPNNKSAISLQYLKEKSER